MLSSLPKMIVLSILGVVSLILCGSILCDANKFLICLYYGVQSKDLHKALTVMCKASTDGWQSQQS